MEFRRGRIKGASGLEQGLESIPLVDTFGY
jgi:hypothetical protein